MRFYTDNECNMKTPRTEQEIREANEFWQRYKSFGKEDAEILAKTGIGQSTLSTWKKKSRFPGADDAVKLAMALSSTVEWLVTGKEELGLKNDEIIILKIFNQLNNTGKEAAVGTIEGLVARFPLTLEQAGVSTGTAS